MNPEERPPAGARPGTIVMPSDAVPPVVHLFTFSESGCEEREVPVDEAIAALTAARAAFSGKGSKGVAWLDVSGLGNEALLRGLADNLGLHPLTLEDIVHTYQRPKVELDAKHALVIMRMLQCGEELSIGSEQISIFFDEHLVVTLQESPGDVFDPVRMRIRQGKGHLRSSGPDYLAYALLDAIVDGYFPVVERFGDVMEALEEEVLERPGQETLRRVNALRRDLTHLRRTAWPQREAIGALLRWDSPLLTESSKTYLRDVQDHTVQIVELIEGHREVASGLFNTYLSVLGIRQNEVMKVLTIMASIFIPLSFLVGLYGMNFDHMPELHWRYGYPALLVIMLGVGGGLVAYFRRRGWIG